VLLVAVIANNPRECLGERAISQPPAWSRESVVRVAKAGLC
jgi:hypothetical protein